jgi:hypothetical protein
MWGSLMDGLGYDAVQFGNGLGHDALQSRI